MVNVWTFGNTKTNIQKVSSAFFIIWTKKILSSFFYIFWDYDYIKQVYYYLVVFLSISMYGYLKYIFFCLISVFEIWWHFLAENKYLQMERKTDGQRDTTFYKQTNKQTNIIKETNNNHLLNTHKK